MNAQLVGAYLEKRMAELGHGGNYTFRVRHLVLLPGEQRELEAWNELFLLLESCCDVRISSGFGVYDPAERSLSEQQHEHRGLITLTNTSASAIVNLQFLQVIPLYPETQKLKQTEKQTTQQTKTNNNGDHHSKV